MVGGAPVAEAADIDGGLLFLRDIRRAAADLRALGLNEADELFGLFLVPENGAEQAHGTEKALIEDATGAGFQRDDGNTQLLLEGIFLLHVLIFGDHDVRIAGEDLLRFGCLCLRPADTAGRKSGEGLSVSEHVGARDGVKHLGALGQGGVVDILDTAQQTHITDIAVHAQCARADADDALVAARNNRYFTADHVRDGDLVLGEGCSAECEQTEHQAKRQKDGNEFTQFHVLLPP